ncbi:hypothetical protein Ancab_008599 [Ancistrocladus abbreviatus]
MADQHSTEGASTSESSGGSSESVVELNIKTLDSQIYSFHADKNSIAPMIPASWTSLSVKVERRATSVFTVVKHLSFSTLVLRSKPFCGKILFFKSTGSNFNFKLSSFQLELLNCQGLAKYVEWSANMMEEDARWRLKLAELQAKKERIRIWTNYVPPPSNSKAIHNQNFTGKVELLAYNDMNVPFQYFDLVEICDARCIYLMAEIFAFNIGFPLDLTQAGLLLEVPTEDLLYEYSRIVLNKNVENLYACGGSIQLHWSLWPPPQNGAATKWFCTSKGLLGAGPSGIKAADAIITDAGAMHVAGVPIVNLSIVVVWEVTPGPGTGFQAIPKTSVNTMLPPSLNPPSWSGFAPLAVYLFSWQEYFLSESKQGKKHTDQDFSDNVSLHCSLVSNFSAYVSPEAAAQSAATTMWGSGVTAVAFDPTRGGSVIAVVIVEGQYMSPYDPDEGPSITGWRVQRWESCLKPVVLHQIFGNPTSSFGRQAPMQTVWETKVNKSIPPTNDFKAHQAVAGGPNADSSAEKGKRVTFDPFDMPSDVRTLARILYSAHGGEVAVAFLRVALLGSFFINS